MPFIDSKITKKLTPEKEEAIKTRLGQAIGIMGKPESFLMVGFEDEYDLYMAGQKLTDGAFVSVSAFGGVDPAQTDRMTAEICKIYGEELGIPEKNIYITYAGVANWGWNGRNF